MLFNGNTKAKSSRIAKKNNAKFACRLLMTGFIVT